MLELSLKPGLAFGDKGLVPGGSVELELKPWANAHNFLNTIKISGGIEMTSEKKDDGSGRVLKLQGPLGIGSVWFAF